MNDDLEPIYDFASLKDFLSKRGYRIGTRDAYEPFTPEVVKAADVRNGRMSFTNVGIYVNCDDGVERQVFLYKKDYHLVQYDKPRIHICKCQIIQEFINSGGFNAHYVRANSEPVPVIDLDDYYQRKQISSLPLCTYCSRIYIGQYIHNSTDFVNLLRSASDNQTDDPQEVELDLFGYTRDWEAISKQYREKQNYTCERCGLKIDDTYDRQYIHVHHINGDKLNNKEENLKCLCLYCHSHVDWVHKRRLTYGANGIIYRNFMDKYSDDIPDEFKDEVEDDDEELIEV